jgi:hypothetical protein
MREYVLSPSDVIGIERIVESATPHPDIDQDATRASVNGELLEARATIRFLGGLVMVLATTTALAVIVASILWGWRA